MEYIKTQDILDLLLAHNKRVFGIIDIAKITGKSPSYISKILSQSKKVKRIERGKYYLNGFVKPDFYEIASNVIFPCYISSFAAFQFYSLTEQSIIKYTVISIKRHRELSVDGNKLEFITIGKDRFFGYKKFGNSFVATVEKAILDSLYLNSLPQSYIEEVLSEALHRNLINKKLLYEFAFKMRSKKILTTLRKMLNKVDPSDKSDINDG